MLPRSRFRREASLRKPSRNTLLNRVRAKIQNSYGLFQANSEVRRRRGKLSEEEKEQAVSQQPDVPIFAVYADESGKTQDHLVVGSMWFPYAAELSSITLSIQRLKESYGFKGELHFRINSRRLDFYIKLAKLPGERANTYSFKAVNVRRRGIANVADAFGDLYYHLLLEG